MSSIHPHHQPPIGVRTLDVRSLSTSAPSWLVQSLRHGMPPTTSIERVAEHVCRRLCSQLVGSGGAHALALARLFLETASPELACSHAAKVAGPDAWRHPLLLVGSWGDRHGWCGCRSSQRHRAVELGADHPSDPLFSAVWRAAEEHHFCHVERALGDERIPDQAFVEKEGIRAMVSISFTLEPVGRFFLLGFTRVPLTTNMARGWLGLCEPLHTLLYPVREAPIFEAGAGPEVGVSTLVRPPPEEER